MGIKHNPLIDSGAFPDDPSYEISTSEYNADHTIDNGSLVAAKLSASGTDVVFGRSTAGAGNGEEIPVTAAGRALLDDANAAAQLVTLGAQPSDADLTAIAGLSPSNDDVLQRKAGAWANRTIAQLLADLAAAGTTFQPLDSDLTSIAALTTTAFGRGLLALADAAAARTALGISVGAKAYNAGTQVVGAASLTAITLGAEEFDTDGFHSTSVNTSRMTVPAGLGGKYLVAGGSGVSAANTTLAIAKNGTRVRSQTTLPPGEGFALAVLDLAAGDYVELMVYHGSGVTVGHASAAEAQSNLSIMRL